MRIDIIGLKIYRKVYSDTDMALVVQPLSVMGGPVTVYNGTLGAGFGHRFDRIANADLTLAKAA